MQGIRSMLGENCYYAAENGERRLRQSEQTSNEALRCPRCDSQNTKFCYYNNYNMSQPRHYCKNCRRYWTKGGVLRNVPVGGGCRKGRRSKLRRISSSAETTLLQVEKQADTVNYNSSGESSNLTTTTPQAECQTFSECLAQGSNSWSFSDVGEFPFRQNHWLPPLIDQTVLQIDSPVAGGFQPFDWQVTGNHVFDVADPVDRAFWTPPGLVEWTDGDHSTIFLP